ncbi:TraB/GumN family protein [Sneathiella marina]|uniref:TraB/GumN family protein n=1 Tax=Sneathiella marina TaxID=2950108 RepID=A0ABY4W5B8_9PROT|nr:TraB/GumN family protein [Sneathiella marina]USG62385.1 TraB/GumN family protein [Sneathiella marina]
MKEISKLLFGLAALLLISVFSQNAVAKVDAPENCEARPYDKGRLWKVMREGAPPNYIFGTMHSKDPRILHLPGVIMQAFNSSHTAVFETSLKNEDMARSQAMMLLPQGQSLRAAIGPERFKKLAGIAAPYGLDAQTLNRVKIWAAAAIISQPPPALEGNAPKMALLDKELEKSAINAGKTVLALETNKEQLNVFDSTPVEIQLEYLDQSILEHARLEEELETITSYYLSGNTGWIACDLEEALASASEGLNYLISEKLVDERNRRMVERMLPALKQGSAFVGIGALHLPGENGVLALLRAKGYSVEKKY